MGAFTRIKFTAGRNGGGVLALDGGGEENGGDRGNGYEGGRKEEDENGEMEKSGFGGEWVTRLRDGGMLSWEKVYTSGPGFHNMGNTCFLNASLQCLLHCPPFLHVLSNKTHSKANGAGRSSGGFCAFCAFEELVPLVYGSNRARGYITPKNFVQNRRSICKTFKPGRQEDAHEFVRHLLDGMVTASALGCGRRVGDGGKRLTHQEEMKTIVHSVFGGCLHSTVSCMSCKAVSIVNEPFLDLSLEINGTNSVTGALEKFTANEKLDGSNRYRCEKCKKHVVAHKRMTIRRAPNTLTLHLKR